MTINKRTNTPAKAITSPEAYAASDWPKTTLQQWRMFKAVASAGGFNQAAALVHKSQSSVHHSVAKLEDILGVKLFAVDGRKTQLTAAGNALLNRAEHLLKEASDMENISQDLTQGVESVVSIAVDGAFPQGVLFSALEATSQLYPNVKIEIIDTILSGSNELVTSGDADIGISPMHIPGYLNEEICIIEFWAVANKDHPLHHLTHQLTTQDLTEYRQIIARDSSQHRNASAGWLGSRSSWTVSNMRSSIELVEQCKGFAWLPKPSIEASLNSGLLIALPLARGQCRHERFYLNIEDETKLGPTARTFIKQIRGIQSI